MLCSLCKYLWRDGNIRQGEEIVDTTENGKSGGKPARGAESGGKTARSAESGGQPTRGADIRVADNGVKSVRDGNSGSRVKDAGGDPTGAEVTKTTKKDDRLGKDHQSNVQKCEEESEEDFDVKCLRESLEVSGFNTLPFLSNKETVDFIRKSRTIFIMRGLPGSGKSRLAHSLQVMYPGAVICSADSYFYDSDGNYKLYRQTCLKQPVKGRSKSDLLRQVVAYYRYDKARISNAHEVCQKKAQELCENSNPVVIIDNTNIQRWAMSFYVRMAQAYCGYHVIIVEPMTPWRYDIEELVQRNSHGVDKETITTKLQSLKSQIYHPFYYGWFLSQEDSSMIATKARHILDTCVDDILDDNGDDEQDPILPTDILSRWDNSSYNDSKPMLHCTACFLGGKGRDPSYNSEDIVKQAIGRKYSLEISGFVYSERAIGARVNLYKDFSSCTNTSRLNSRLNSNQASEVLQLFRKDEEHDLREKHKDDKGYVQNLKYFQHGCSAHVTVMFACEGQAKHSGEDVLNICEMDYNCKGKSRETSIGTLTAYEGKMYSMTLRKPIRIETLFHGFYSVRN